MYAGVKDLAENPHNLQNPVMIQDRGLQRGDSITRDLHTKDLLTTSCITLHEMANMNASFTGNKLQHPACFKRCAVRGRLAARAAAQATDDLGFKMMRRGVKEASNETLLSPRFYTTDFDTMETMFS